MARTWIELAAGCLAGAVAEVYFARHTPMRVVVGTQAIATLVPPHYQASVFPAFGAFVTAAALEWRGEPRLAHARAAMVVLSGALATLRLAGTLPLSGHAVFLAAAFAFDVLEPRSAARTVRLGLSAAGLAVTTYYKIAWSDLGWGALSLTTGATLGIATHCLVSRRV